MVSISDTLDMVAQVRDRLMRLPAAKITKVCKKINTILDAEHKYRASERHSKASQSPARRKVGRC
jgi:hypothetical protein